MIFFQSFHLQLHTALHEQNTFFIESSLWKCASPYSKAQWGLVTLKNKLLEKSLNLANNPVEDTLVLVFLLQIHATGWQDCTTEPHSATPFGLPIHKVLPVLPLLRWLPKSSFVKKKPVSQDSLSLCCELPQGMLVVIAAWESQEATPALVLLMTCGGGRSLPQRPPAPKGPRATFSPKLSRFTYDSVFQFSQPAKQHR